MRNLSRLWWILLILLVPFVGSAAWLATERAEEQRRTARERKRRELEGDAGEEAGPA